MKRLVYSLIFIIWSSFVLMACDTLRDAVKEDEVYPGTVPAKTNDNSGTTDDNSTGTTDNSSGTSTASSKVLSGFVATFVSDSSRQLGRSIAEGDNGTSSTSSSVKANAGVKAVVSLYLLADTDFKYPVATVKTEDNGTYTVEAEDVKSFFTDNETLSEISTNLGFPVEVVNDPTDENLLAAFQALGPLNVRAMYVKEIDGEKKAIAIQGLADPAKPEVEVAVNPIVHRLVSQIVTAITSTLQQTLASVSRLSDTLKASIVSAVISSVSETVTQVLEQAAETDELELDEGQTASDLESYMAVDSADVSTLETELNSTKDDISDASGLKNSFAYEDSGKLSSTLSSEESGFLDQLGGQFSESAVSAASAGDNTTLKNIEKESLQKFFLALGFPVVLAKNDNDSTAVIAISLTSPPQLSESQLPGSSTFKSRDIRHFKIGNGTISGSYSTASVLDIDSIKASFGASQDAVNTLLTKTDKTDNESNTLESLRVYHRLAERMEETELISDELISDMLDHKNDNASVKRVAAVVAGSYKWVTETVNITPDGLPIYSGRFVTPSSGGTVSSTDLVKKLSLTLESDSIKAAQTLASSQSFWAQYVGDLIESAINNSSQFSTDIDAVLGNVYQKNASDYPPLLKKGDSANNIPPGPAYNDARDKMARGLVAALPKSLYGTTLTSETNVNMQTALFMINYLLQSKYLVNSTGGFFKDIDIAGTTRKRPYYSNLKQLKLSNEETSVADLVASLLGVTLTDEGDAFEAAEDGIADSRGSSGVLAGLWTLPEFEDAKDLSETFGLTKGSSASVSCTVKKYDDSDPQNEDSNKTLKVQVIGITYDNYGNPTKGDVITNGSTTSGTDAGSNKRTYSFTEVPAGDYVMRFSIASYQNDLPEIFFFVDGFSSTLDLCPTSEPYVIGPDVDFDVPIPSLGLRANQKIGDEFEGADLSNYSEPGKPFILTQNSSEGKLDFYLTEVSGSYILKATDSNAGFRKLYGTPSSVTTTAGAELYDLAAVLGSDLKTAVQAVHSGSLDTNFILSVAEFREDLGCNRCGQVILFRDPDQKYWLLELQFMEQFEGPVGTEVFIEIGFAQVLTSGSVQIPGAGFSAGPVDEGKAALVQHHQLFFGDGVNLDDGNIIFSMDFGGEVTTDFSEAHLRYAGDYFTEKVDTISDIDSLDFSKIPVRLDGQNGVKLAALKFKSSSKSYTLDNTTASYIPDLGHGDLLAVYKEGSSTSSPDYIVRVLRIESFNDQIELDVVSITDEIKNASDPEQKKLGVFEADSSVTGYPSVSGGITGVIYDADYDGVPFAFDINDEDSNIGADDGGGFADIGDTTESGMPGGEGVNLMLMNKQSSATATTTTRYLAIETNGVYPGEIKAVKLSNADLGWDKVMIFTCSPPSFTDGSFSEEADCSKNDNLNFTVTKNFVSFDMASFSIQPSVAVFKSGGALDVSSSSRRTNFEFEVSFREPVGPDGNTLYCGDEVCPVRSSIKGSIQIYIPTDSKSVGTFSNVKIKEGSTGTATAIGDVSSVDASKEINIFSSIVSSAREYELNIFCAGQETETTYLETVNMSFYAPGFGPSGATPPSFKIPTGTVPGGRSCDFDLIAFGENDLGEFIGITLLSNPLTLTGGFQDGFVDNELLLSAGDTICYDNSTYMVSVSTGGCTGATTILTVDSTFTGSDLPLTIGSEVDTASLTSPPTPLAEGNLNSGSSLSVDSLDNPTCGYIDGDGSDDPFECDSAGISLFTLTSGQITIAESGYTFNETETTISGDNGFYMLGNSTNHEQFEVQIDKFDGNVSVRLQKTPSFQDVSGSTTLTQGKMITVQVGNQPIDLETRYIKNGSAKLAWFLPPPEISASDGATLDINEDGVADLTWSGGKVSFTGVDSSKQIYPGYVDPVPETGITIEDGEEAEFEVEINGVTYGVIAFNNGGSLSLEKFEKIGGGTEVGDIFEGWILPDESLFFDYGLFSTGDTASGDSTQIVVSLSGNELSNNGWTLTWNGVSASLPDLMTMDTFRVVTISKMIDGQEYKYDLEIQPPFIADDVVQEVSLRILPSSGDDGGDTGTDTGTDNGTNTGALLDDDLSEGFALFDSGTDTYSIDVADSQTAGDNIIEYEPGNLLTVHGGDLRHNDADMSALDEYDQLDLSTVTAPIVYKAYDSESSTYTFDFQIQTIDLDNSIISIRVLPPQ